MAQHSIHALRRPDGGDHQLVGVDAGKIQLIPGVLCELRQKDALCPPVALAERVKLVGADVKINEGVYKIGCESCHEIESLNVRPSLTPSQSFFGTRNIASCATQATSSPSCV